MSTLEIVVFSTKSREGWENAVVIDNSNMSIDEQIKKIIHLIDNS